MNARVKPESATTAARWNFEQTDLLVRCGIEVYAIKVNGVGFPRQSPKPGSARYGEPTQKEYLQNYQAAINRCGPTRGKIDAKLQDLSAVLTRLDSPFPAIPGFKPHKLRDDEVMPHVAKDYAAAMATEDAGFWKLAKSAVAQYRAGMVSSVPRTFGKAA